MKPVSNYRGIAVEIICSLFIILLIYAAVSKLLYLDQFRTQIEQSPLLGAYTDLIALGIPVAEIIISLLFFFPKLKLVGLWSAFILMVIFTTYILIVLNFSSSIPCSCGGVIASLSWNEHLIFNLGFIILAALGVLMYQPINKEKIEGNKNYKNILLQQEQGKPKT